MELDEINVHLSDRRVTVEGTLLLTKPPEAAKDTLSAIRLGNKLYYGTL